MKKLVVLGARESGTGAALLGRKLGMDVLVSDAGALLPRYRDLLVKEKITFEEGGHTINLLLDADLVVKSPGIPDTAAAVSAIKQSGVPVISEIEFASQHTGAIIIGITGSNGKTTTTLLIHHILQQAGYDVGLAGNVGHSFAGAIATTDHKHYVVELSSFQLDDITDFRPNVAVLLNITPDHLDRYGNRMERYRDSKFRITLNQTANDHFIYCADDPVIREGMNEHRVKAQTWPFSIERPLDHGGFIKNDQLHIHTHPNPFSMSIIDLALQGKHNIYNSLAAGIAARVLEVKNDTIRESLSDFKNIEHRLEHVSYVNGIEFINDSKATNVNSTWYALESMDRPVIWIAGGVDKGNDYGQLMDLVKQKVKVLICMGTDNEKLLKTFNGVVPTLYEADSAYEAVRVAYEVGDPGDAVLLSPACASFDLFKNYEDRGMQFKHAVKAL